MRKELLYDLYQINALIRTCIKQSAHQYIANIFLFLFFFFDWASVACGILVPQPEIEPSPSAVRTQSPNHWTTSKFLLVPLVNQSYKGKKARSEGFVNCDSVPAQHGSSSDGWKVLHLLRQLCKVTLDSMWEFKGGVGGGQAGSINYRGTVSLMYLFDSPKSGVTREGRIGDAEMS